ncbi:uncharacterized protein LOC125953796 [Anopheles darlingi]|uniref:uncharacterized protein LOC125953796 n=1 Tax=Anopheles darlingi TaxID=43151 RepID=UPI0021002534|nr:uncharacterized protein LOC125953796 [Anopheles darlingi]
MTHTPAKSASAAETTAAEVPNTSPATPRSNILLQAPLPSVVDMLRQLTEEMRVFKRDLTELQTVKRRRGRSRQGSESRGRLQGRGSLRNGPPVPHDSELCWYHNRFGDNATRCREPCKKAGSTTTGEERQSRQGARVVAHTRSHAAPRLCIRDFESGTSFLIDSGAELSLVPRDRRLKNIKPTEVTLVAANGTRIPVFGEVTMKINLGLRRAFIWTFIIADVNTAIIGADFLVHYDLLVDLKRKRPRPLTEKRCSRRST